MKPTEKLGLFRIFLGELYYPFIWGFYTYILVKGENKLILKRRRSYWILLLGDGFKDFENKICPRIWEDELVRTS